MNKCLLFLFVFGAIPAGAQFYQFKNYNVKDGLPSSEVYAMMQDAAGYMWFTTDIGVSRFDGYEFKNFSTENGLADNSIFGLVQDDKGRIWFRSFSGKLSYYENEKMHALHCNSKLEKLLRNNLVVSLFIDRGDTIWAGTLNDNILKIAPGWEDENVKMIPIKSTHGYLLLFDGGNFIYGGYARGAFDIDVYNRQFVKQYNVPININQGDQVRYAVIRLGDGTFVATIDKFIIRFNSGGVISKTKINSIIICSLEENNGNIFMGSYDGVKQYADNTFSAVSTISKLDRKVVTSICQDHENGLWFCTEGNGVFYVPFRNFLYYTHSDGLSESKISCVTKAGDKTICGHLDGTISLIEKQQVQNVAFNRDTVFSSRTNRVSNIFYSDTSGILFIGTILNTFSFDINKLSVEKTWAQGSKKIIPSRDGNIWALQLHRLVKLKLSSDFEIIGQIPISFYADNIYEDHTGKVWICPSEGIWTYDSISGLVFEGKTNPLQHARIVEVREASDGSIWMASRGNGVIIKRGNDYFNITLKDGLAGNMCRTIFIDSGNVIWVGTNNGLSKIVIVPGDEFKYTIETYTSKNGLFTDEINNIIDQGGKLWLVHNDGISIFDPNDIQNNNSPPPVYITNTLVNGDTLSSQNAFALPYYRNYFNIGFIGLSYKNPGRMEYKYKMEGIDSNWIYTPYTSVNYQTLPPGNYRFVVYARNNDGYWSKKPASFSFAILPAWWQTWTFRIVAGIFLSFLIAVVFKIRLDVIRAKDQKKAVLQNRIAAIELNALRAQMNPHFVFNSINSVQYFITNNDPDSSQKYLSKFAKLIRYVVDNSKLTSIPIKNEIEALTLYLDLEALRFGTRFEYEIRVHENVDTQYTQIPSMLIQPYVENSIWHGIMHKNGNGKITVSLEMKNEVLHCIVEDNGIGRQKSRELKNPDHRHESVGMSNTKERLDIINHVTNSNMSVRITDLHDEKGEARGTCVEIQIPSSYIS